MSGVVCSYIDFGRKIVSTLRTQWIKISTELNILRQLHQSIIAIRILVSAEHPIKCKLFYK